jgi:NAD(P)-dependent dehydrogenase (short-subunit alcohol dehydrogenase family)
MTRTAAITGAASGIGQAACLRLPDAGWPPLSLGDARARLSAVASRFSLDQDRFKPILGDAPRVTAAFQAATFVPPGFNP